MQAYSEALSLIMYFSFFPLPKYVSVLLELQYVQRDARSQKGNIREQFSEPFLSSSRNTFKEYLMYEFSLPLIAIACVLISVLSLPYVRTESGIQKRVCWRPTFNKLFC